MTKKIVQEVKEAKFYALIADEVVDISNTEQMSIVVRYVDCQCEIREEFIAFVSCKIGTTEEVLSANILTMLQKHWLKISLLHGQKYDGAGAAAGCVRGVAASFNHSVP